VKVLVWLCLALGAALATTGCVARLSGASGPLAWQVTDLKVVKHLVAGEPRDLYTFTLVLTETQGATLTFTHMAYTVVQPATRPTGISHTSAIQWKLRPHGERREPFALSYHCEGQCRSMVLWYNLVLTGTDTRGQPVRIALDFQIPLQPAGLSLARTTETSGQASGAVPFRTVGNHILVHAVLNQKEVVSLLVDTGASRTLLRPDVATRVGVNPTEGAPKQQVTIIGGRQVEVPLVPLATLAVGNAAASLHVGILSSFPEAPFVDGLLGGDFLEQFTMTLDYTASRLWFTPHGTAPLPVTTAASSRTAVPIRLAGGLILVRAVLNHTAPVTLLLDTGASYTMLTPEAARRSGLSSAPSAPTKTLTRADGQRHDVPFVHLVSLKMGRTVVEHMPLGIAVLFPQAPGIDGVLGVDFLGRFTVTLDRAHQQMWLEAR
jgi:predicted aspartyl protease